VKSIKCLDVDRYDEIYTLIDRIDYTKYLFKEIEDKLVYGLISNKILLGLYRLRPLKEYILLYDIYIKQPYRHCGYGTMLLKHAEKIAKQMEYKSLRVWTNDSYGTAYTFYSKCGYILIKYCKEGEFLFEKEFK
jgi:GNAT superfamily N-acetyltransferase